MEKNIIWLVCIIVALIITVYAFVDLIRNKRDYKSKIHIYNMLFIGMIISNIVIISILLYTLKNFSILF